MPGLLLREGSPWIAGGPADLLVRDGGIAKLGSDLDPGDAEETPAHAVVTRPPRDLVLKAGHVVARSGAPRTRSV